MYVKKTVSPHMFDIWTTGNLIVKTYLGLIVVFSVTQVSAVRSAYFVNDVPSKRTIAVPCIQCWVRWSWMPSFKSSVHVLSTCSIFRCNIFKYTYI